MERADHGEVLWPMAFTAPAKQVLCVFASGDLERTLVGEGVDWDEVYQGACSKGLLGLAHRYARQGLSRAILPAWFTQAVADAFRGRAMRMALFSSTADRVMAMLNAAGLDYLVVKGPAIALTVYPDPSLRIFSDLDIIIHERDWAKAHRIAVEAGFEPDGALPNPPPKIIPSAVRLEQQYRRKGFLLEFHYDDILNAGLAARDVEGFWRRAVTVTQGKVPFRTLCPADHLVFLCQHVHYHGFFRLNWLADLAFMIRDHGHALDWDQVVATVRTEEAQVPVYYSLCMVERHLGVSAPPQVLAAVKPDRFRLWAHERYLPSNSVLSEHPCWPPFFSFYHTPFFRRLLPDLLVMGRRREKLHYLFRLLTPPRDWLMYYYDVRNPRLVWPHYVLNPIKLTIHIGEEVVAAIGTWLKRALGSQSGKPAPPARPVSAQHS
ncbi:MAG: nucleotidyltransferase domain-containing protein [Anaerolineae bacterium]